MDGDTDSYIDTHEDADGTILAPDGKPLFTPEGYGRTNDAVLWSWEWENGTGAYRICLDYVCNGHLVTRDHIATIHYGGRVERHLQPFAGRTPCPSHRGLYAVVELLTHTSTASGSGERGQ